MATLSIRVDLANGSRLGPGKIALLRAIAEAGSISSGAQRLGMSYRRAWLLVAEMNRDFREPVLNASAGGKEGGGATLTAFGSKLVAAYEDLSVRAAAAVSDLTETLDGEVAPRDRQASEQKRT